MELYPNKPRCAQVIGGVEEQVTLAVRHLGGLHLCRDFVMS